MAIRGRAGGTRWTRESQLQWSQESVRAAGEPLPVQLPAASTDGVRGPLSVGRRERSPQHFLSVFVAASLLTTTLAGGVAPSDAQARTPTFSLKQERTLHQVADTSRGMPATLRMVVAAALPVGESAPTVLPSRRATLAATDAGQPLALKGAAIAAIPPGEASFASAPASLRVLASTSASTPKPLTLDAQLPVGEAAHVGTPRERRVVSDTAEGQPLTLQAPPAAPPPGQMAWVQTPTRFSQQTVRMHRADSPAAAAPELPPGKTAQLAPQARPHLPADGTADQPVVLKTPIAAPPPGRAVHVAPATYRWQATPILWRRLGTPAVDTGPLPVGQQSSIAPPKLKWLPADESAGTPKPLYIDDTYACTNLCDSAPTLRRPGPDTSQGSWALTHPAAAVALPPGESLQLAPPARQWTLAAWSQSAWPLTVPAQALPPGEASFVAAPRAVWRVVDTSQSQPGTLRLVLASVPPGTALQVAALDQRRVLADTSQEAYPLLQPAVVPALPAGASSFTATPRQLWAVVDTSQETPKTLTADAQLPVGEASAVSTPRERRIASETSSSTPVAITGAPVPPPIVNLPYPVPDRVRPVADTSQSAWAVTHPLPPLPPGKVSFVGAPRWVWLNGSTTYESPPVAIQNVAVGGIPGPAGHGYQRVRIHLHRPGMTDTARPRSPNTRRGRQ